MSTASPSAHAIGLPAPGASTKSDEVVPPLARRPVISPAMALREEMTDSWRLLGATLGAAALTAMVLYLLALVMG